MLTRTKVDWSNSTDLIVGPCAVCGKEVRFVIPDDRPSPSILYHSTCDVMPLLREQLKKASPPLMPAEHVISKPKPATPPPAAAATPTPATPAAPAAPPVG
jgi:hypothetical protein